jgi:hypothetical protein
VLGRSQPRRCKEFAPRSIVWCVGCAASCSQSRQCAGQLGARRVWCQPSRRVSFTCQPNKTRLGHLTWRGGYCRMLPSMVERTPHTSICSHCTCHHSRMDMPELVRQCCRGDAGARGGVLYDVVHSAFGEWLPWPTYRAEHGSRCRSVTTAGKQPLHVTQSLPTWWRLPGAVPIKANRLPNQQRGAVSIASRPTPRTSSEQPQSSRACSP